MMCVSVSFNDFVAIIYLAFCLVLTVAVEGIVAMITTKSKEVLKVSVLCNLLTNPMLNALLIVGTYFFGLNGQSVGYYVALSVLEIAVVFVEGEVYRYLNLFDKRKKAYLMSFIFNLSSFAVGAILTFILALT